MGIGVENHLKISPPFLLQATGVTDWSGENRRDRSVCLRTTTSFWARRPVSSWSSKSGIQNTGRNQFWRRRLHLRRDFRIGDLPNWSFIKTIFYWTLQAFWKRFADSTFIWDTWLPMTKEALSIPIVHRHSCLTGRADLKTWRQSQPWENSTSVQRTDLTQIKQPSLFLYQCTLNEIYKLNYEVQLHWKELLLPLPPPHKLHSGVERKVHNWIQLALRAEIQPKQPLGICNCHHSSAEHC